MTVVLDPGHGGIDSSGIGACYPPFAEKQLNYFVAENVKNKLEEAGVEVYLTRTSDTNPSLEERAAYAASVGADLLVSIHFNSSGPHDKMGSEIWTSMFSPYYDTGYAVGDSILQELSSLGFINKGVKTRLGVSGDYYGIIRHGTSYGIPTIIIEHCFIDNFVDRMILGDVGVASLAQADADGLLNYIESIGELREISESHSVYEDDSEPVDVDNTVEPEPASKRGDLSKLSKESKTIGMSVAHSISDALSSAGMSVAHTLKKD